MKKKSSDKLPWDVAQIHKQRYQVPCPVIDVLILFYSYTLEHSISLSDGTTNSSDLPAGQTQPTKQKQEGRGGLFSCTEEVKMKNTCWLVLLCLFGCVA